MFSAIITLFLCHKLPENVFHPQERWVLNGLLTISGQNLPREGALSQSFAGKSFFVNLCDF